MKTLEQFKPRILSSYSERKGVVKREREGERGGEREYERQYIAGLDMYGGEMTGVLREGC